MTKPKKTVNIDVELHRQLAAMAAERGKTIGQFVDDLLRAQVAQRWSFTVRRLSKQVTKKKP